jgi:multimeric flavodoxin WrbA
MKKVLLINGSPHAQGNTALALQEAAQQLEKDGVATETIWIGTQAVQGCIACGYCKEHGVCVFRDAVNDTAEKLRAADGLIVGSPVYYAGPNGTLCAFLDRLFSSAGHSFDGKPAASVAVCRRGGASATFDRLNKYFTISNMPVVSSQYWNSVHGRTAGEAAQDGEGLQTMRTLADNMAWLLRALDGIPHPVREARVSTNFVR